MGWEIFPTALLNLPQNLVICIKRVTSTTLLKLSQYWAVCIENILLIKNVNEIPKIEVFIGSFLNFTIMGFTWCLANNDNIYKNQNSVKFDQ